MKIPNTRGLQQIAINYLSDIGFTNFKKCILKKPFRKTTFSHFPRSLLKRL